jgi:DNA-binding transcriptional MerR regulator
MLGMSAPRKGFTIKTVSERTNVSLHVLRAWERRYGVPQPSREPGNRYRLYDEADIADVLWLKEQIARGLTPSQASALLRERRDAAPAAPAATLSVTGQALALPAQPITTYQSALQTALIRLDERTAQQVLDEALGLFAPEQVAWQLILPTLREIGERWQRNEVSIEQEHTASQIVRQKVSALLQALPASSVMSPRLIAACAPEEQHEIGLMIFTWLARRQGWQVNYLGQCTPLASLKLHAQAFKPQAIVMSVTTAIGLASLIPWLNESERPRAKLLFGGYVLSQSPNAQAHLPGLYLGDEWLHMIPQLVAPVSPPTWAPAKRALRAARSLQEQSLYVAGKTLETFLERLGAATRKLPRRDLSFETLHLIHSVSCALAFDAPEVLDWQTRWLKTLLEARGTSWALLSFAESFAKTLSRTLDSEAAQTVNPLITHWRELVSNP